MGVYQVFYERQKAIEVCLLSLMVDNGIAIRNNVVGVSVADGSGAGAAHPTFPRTPSNRDNAADPGVPGPQGSGSRRRGQVTAQAETQGAARAGGEGTATTRQGA